MTKLITVDRAVLEQLVVALEMPCDRWSAVQFEIAADAIKAGRASLANAEPMECAWTKDPDFEMGDTYHSACGEAWSFIDGGPAENRVKFCQGCGKPVKQSNPYAWQNPLLDPSFDK